MSIREAVARAMKEADRREPYANSLRRSHLRTTTAINTFLEAAAEQGWHMRPDEATEVMDTTGYGFIGGKRCYREMLAVATKFEWDK